MTLEPESALACRDLVERTTDFLEGALAPAGRSGFEAHLSACAGCAAYVSQIRQTLRLARRLGRLGVGAVAPETRAALLAAFRECRPRPNGAGV